MPKFYLHLVDSIDVTLDPDGVEMPEEAVIGAALMAARDCMCGDVRSGQLDLRYRIDVHNEAGELVHCLPFAEAVDVIRQS